jgi:hypothetical protein
MISCGECIKGEGEECKRRKVYYPFANCSHEWFAKEIISDTC